MIVPMKKVTLIVQAKDKETTIEKLAELGVLHIEHLQEPKGRELNLLKEEMQRLEEAKTLLSAFSPSVRGKERLLDGKSFIIQVIDLGKRIKDLKEYTYRLEEEIKFWETWGDFEPEIIKELEKKNIYIRLYQIPLRELKKIPEDIVIKEISSQKGMVNCLLISRKEISFPFKKIPLPEMGLGKMKRVLQEKKDLLLSLEKEMREKSSFLPALEEIRVELEKEKELAEAKIGMGEFGPLSYLRGYLPRESLEKFLNFSREQAWGILIADPSPEDSVPTLLRNPPWIRILDPLFRFLAILPGYEELDISFWFLIFLCLFFGILIGDAGYGMVYLVLTFWAKRKWGERIKEKALFTLFYLLSFSAILWGIFSGTIFGQAWHPHFIKPLLPPLRNDKVVQNFCFFLGALHLSIAHFWKFLLKLPSLFSFAELGWISILWGAYFLARMLILGEILPEFVRVIFLLGVSLVVLFTHPQKNIIKGWGEGMGALFLNLVSNFTDVVSYIRLFAVGLAGVAIADSFHRIALDFAGRGFFSSLITAFILILGHTLNLLLGPMSVLVHGVRLNLLEFCNHLEVKWKGFPYQPLRK